MDIILKEKKISIIKKIKNVYNNIDTINNLLCINYIDEKNGTNICYKNPYYGELTFHYWFWKNKIDQIDDGTWIGFCAYRRFWLNSKKNIL